MLVKLVKQAHNTDVFMKMAALALRHIAEETPDIAIELLQMAKQLEAEAEGLVAAIPSHRSGA